MSLSKKTKEAIQNLLNFTSECYPYEEVRVLAELYNIQLPPGFPPKS